MVTRRHFIATAAAFSASCTLRGARSPTPSADTRVREPTVGQQWRYVQRDLVTGATVDTQTDRVTAVGRTVAIESSFDKAARKPLAYPPWEMRVMEKYMGRPMPGPLASEIQAPWGLILVDPHWQEIQVYQQPIPLWPRQLRPGWSTTVNTTYTTPESSDELPWQLTMHAHRWETVTVPAGRYVALRYANVIDFRYTNVSERVAAQRLETVWLAPEIGRWVARESAGTFYQDVGERFHENNYRWELLDWS